jgi:hypothetical protein
VSGDRDDWRLTGQEKYLTGAVLIWRKYRQYEKNPIWDHDHCEFCHAKFSLREGPEDLDEGYSTGDEHRWICESCFAGFEDRFKWTVRIEGSG